MRVFVVALLLIALAAGCGSGGSTTTTTDGGTQVAGALDGSRVAELDVESGASSVTVRAAALGGDLYRVSTPSGAGIRPDVVRHGGRVQVFLVSAGSGPAAVTVLVARGVRWELRFDGGATDVVANLGGARLSSVDFVAGDSHIGLTLPAPHGSVPVRMAGGASQFTIEVPSGVPVRTSLDGGAGSVELDGVTHTGVAGGTVFTPFGWTAAADRYDVVAQAGVSALTVGNSS